MSLCFQPGDVTVMIEGNIYRARLTMGALAELSQRLNANGPAALARVFQSAKAAQMDMALRAVLRPVHGEVKGDLNLSKLDIIQCLAALFEHSFERGSDG